MKTRKKKAAKALSILLTLLMLFCMFPMTAMAETVEFSDTWDHWAKDSIERWSDYGIVNGMPEGYFNPDGGMTRAQAASVFAKLLNLKPARPANFIDVPTYEWYVDPIARVVAAGIMNGMGDGLMNPEGYVSREQFFVMFARALGIHPQETTSGVPADGSDYSTGYINALTDKGFVKGDENGVNALADISRASVVALLDQTISTYANVEGAKVKAAGSGVTLIVADGVTLTGKSDMVAIGVGAEGTKGVTVNDAEIVQLNVLADANVELAGDTKVEAVSVDISADGSRLTVDKNATVGTIDSEASNSTIDNKGTVTGTITTTGEKTDVSNSGSVASIDAKGKNAEVSNTGKVSGNITATGTVNNTGTISGNVAATGAVTNKGKVSGSIAQNGEATKPAESSSSGGGGGSSSGGGGGGSSSGGSTTNPLYTVSVDSVANGRVTANKTTNVTAGTTVTLTVAPNTGYKLAALSVKIGSQNVAISPVFDASNPQSSYTFVKQDGAVSVTPRFEAITYSITKAATANGSFSVAATAQMGNTVTITASPASGYEVDTVSVTGNPTLSGTGNTRTFTMPASDVTVSVTFRALPATTPTISAQPSNLNLTVGYTSGNVLTAAANAIAGHNLAYTWYKCTNANKSGATQVGTGTSYTVEQGKTSGTTEYYFCRITATRTDNSLTATADSTVATVEVVAATPAPTVSNISTEDTKSLTLTAGYGSGNTVELAATAVTGITFSYTEKTDAGNCFGINAGGTVTFDIGKGAGTYTGIFTITAQGDGTHFTNATATKDVTVTVTVNPVAPTASNISTNDETIPALTVGYNSGNTVSLAASAVTGITFSYEETSDTGNCFEIDAAGLVTFATGKTAGTYTATFTVTAHGDGINFASSPDATKTVTVSVTVNAQVPTESNISTTNKTQTLTEGYASAYTVSIAPSEIVGLTFSYAGDTGNDAAFSVNDAGTVTFATGKTANTYTGTFTITAQGDNSHFTNATATKTVTVTVTVTAAPTYDVAIADGITNGTVSADPSSALAGAEVSLTITPNTGYRLATLTVSGASGEVSVTNNRFTMPNESVTVSAVFAENNHTVGIADNITNGTVNAAPTSAKEGDEVTLTATPATGYVLGSYTVTKESGGTVTVTDNKFRMPNEAVTVDATFEQIPPTTYTATAATGITGGGISVSPNTAVTQGTEITVTVTPDYGYELTALTYTYGGGSPTDILSTKTFEMPAANVTVSATFSLLNAARIANNETDFENAMSDPDVRIIILGADIDASTISASKWTDGVAGADTGNPTTRNNSITVFSDNSSKGFYRVHDLEINLNGHNINLGTNRINVGGLGIETQSFTITGSGIVESSSTVSTLFVFVSECNVTPVIAQTVTIRNTGNAAYSSAVMVDMCGYELTQLAATKNIALDQIRGTLTQTNDKWKINIQIETVGQYRATGASNITELAFKAPESARLNIRAGADTAGGTNKMVTFALPNTVTLQSYSVDDAANTTSLSANTEVHQDSGIAGLMVLYK